jgi:hypothetical protein
MGRNPPPFRIEMGIEFSITAATLITQYGDDDDGIDRLTRQFIRQLRLDIDLLASPSSTTS